MDQGWNVLRCSGADTVAIGEALSDMGGYAPYITIRRRLRKGGWSKFDIPVLPSFVFVPEGAAAFAARAYAREASLMHIDTKLVVIPHVQIAEMEATIEDRRRRWERLGRSLVRVQRGPTAPGIIPPLTDAPEQFKRGERVIIAAGPFKGFEAIVIEVGAESIKAEFGGIFGTIEISPFLLRRHHAE